MYNDHFESVFFKPGKFILHTQMEIEEWKAPVEFAGQFQKFSYDMHITDMHLCYNKTLKKILFLSSSSFSSNLRFFQTV